eukprot:4774594-Prymnesium_polylepis.1
MPGAPREGGVTAHRGLRGGRRELRLSTQRWEGAIRDQGETVSIGCGRAQGEIVSIGCGRAQGETVSIGCSTGQGET